MTLSNQQQAELARVLQLRNNHVETGFMRPLQFLRKYAAPLKYSKQAVLMAPPELSISCGINDTGLDSAQAVGPGAVPTVMAGIDSLSHGQAGLTGGYKPRVQAAVNFVGPYTDEVGLNHAGRDGDYIQDASAPDGFDRIAAQIIAAAPTEGWWTGGTNDAAGGSASAATMATRMANFIGEAKSANPALIQRVFSPPPWNPSTGATTELERFWRRHLQPVVDQYRAAGDPVYYHHTGGRLQTADLDTAMSRHPLDGVYDVNGYGLWAAWIDRYLKADSHRLDPASLSLVCDYREDGYSDATGIWSDASGNGFHLPSISTKATNATGSRGQQTIHLNNSPLRLSFGSTFPQPFTWVFCVDSVDNTATQPALFDGPVGGARHLLQPSATGQLRIWAGSGYGVDDFMLMNAVPHVYAVEVNGASTKTYCDGAQRMDALSPGANGTSGLTVGGSASPSPGNLYQGKVGRIFGFAGTLTELQHFQLACWFREEWKLWELLGGGF